MMLFDCSERPEGWDHGFRPCRVCGSRKGYCLCRRDGAGAGADVTALVQGLIGSVESLISDKIEYEISPGRADIHYGDLSEAGTLLVDSFFIGVCQIADEFPDYVRIE